MSKEAITKIKKAISTLKSAAKGAATLLTDLSNQEYEPGDNITDEVPLIAHQLQRYQTAFEEQLQYAGKEPAEITADKQKEKEEAIARMQAQAAEALNALNPVQPEPEPAEPAETEPSASEPGTGAGGEEPETPGTPTDQKENPDDQQQEDQQPPVE